MKKINELLEEYATNRRKQESLKNDKDKAIDSAASAGKVDKPTIESIKSMDIGLEILRAAQLKLRAAMVSQVKPENEAAVAVLSQKLAGLYNAQAAAKQVFMAAVASAVAKLEAMTFKTRQFYDAHKGAVSVIDCPALDFDPARLDPEERKFYAAVIADARKKTLVENPLDRQIDAIRAEIGKHEKTMAKDPANVVDELLKTLDPAPIEEVKEPEPKKTTVRTIDYDKVNVNYNKKH